MKKQLAAHQVLWQAAETALAQLRGQGQYRGRAMLLAAQHRIILECELRGAVHDLHYVSVVIGHSADDTYYTWQGGLHYLKYVDDMAALMAAACACARGLPHVYSHPDRASYKP